MYFTLITMTILGILFLAHMFIEAKSPKLTELKLKVQSNIVPIRILQLSDIHIKISPFSWKKVLYCVKKASPDLIVLTGDYIDNQKHIPRFIKFMKAINTKGIPTYAVLGNHDISAFTTNKRTNQIDVNAIAEFRKELKAAGIILLENENVQPLPDRNPHIRIIGISDLNNFLDDVDKAFDSVETNDYNVVLGHNPDLVFKLPEKKTSIFVCGHFHGGQIWLPFNLEYKMLRKERLAKARITRGLNLVCKLQIYINRGLGCVIFPMRLHSSPELMVMQINTD